MVTFELVNERNQDVDTITLSIEEIIYLNSGYRICGKAYTKHQTYGLKAYVGKKDFQTIFANTSVRILKADYLGLVSGFIRGLFKLGNTSSI